MRTNSRLPLVERQAMQVRCGSRPGVAGKGHSYSSRLFITGEEVEVLALEHGLQLLFDFFVQRAAVVAATAVTTAATSPAVVIASRAASGAGAGAGTRSAAAACAPGRV